MRVTVYPGEIRGKIAAIPSKSHAIRLLIAAALSKEPTRIGLTASSGDIRATVDCLLALCADIERDSGGYFVRPRGACAEASLSPGESGCAYRFLLPVAAALGAKARFSLSGRLPERPMEPLFAQLEAHGAAISGRGEALTETRGRLSGGRFLLPGGISSQFVSGLMLAIPLTGEPGEIDIEGRLESRGYVDMTAKALRDFSIDARVSESRVWIPGGSAYRSPGAVSAEGDWSAAAFWLCAAAASGGEAQITGLSADSAQGDRAVLPILASMGARVSLANGRAGAAGGGLTGREIDVRDIPDLVPPLAIAALAAKGETAFTGAGRLRLKESDRMETIVSALREIGAQIRCDGDRILVRGGKRLSGGPANARGDHRIAMLLGCAAVLCDSPVVISGAEAVRKSYPGFFSDLAALGLRAEGFGNERSEK